MLFQLVCQGSVDLFLHPREIIEVASESTERCSLPVQVPEASPRAHFWQLIVQPIGWHQGLLNVVLPGGDATPVHSGRYYIGSLNACLLCWQSIAATYYASQKRLIALKVNKFHFKGNPGVAFLHYVPQHTGQK